MSLERKVASDGATSGKANSDGSSPGVKFLVSEGMFAASLKMRVVICAARHAVTGIGEVRSLDTGTAGGETTLPLLVEVLR